MPVHLLLSVSARPPLANQPRLVGFCNAESWNGFGEYDTLRREHAAFGGAAIETLGFPSASRATRGTEGANMKKRLALIATCLLISSVAMASNWKNIPGLTTYVDLDSAHLETFPLVNIIAGSYFQTGKFVNYLAVWIKIYGTNNDLLATNELLLDCNGHTAALQQIIANESPTSQYHSFNYTSQ